MFLVEVSAVYTFSLACFLFASLLSCPFLHFTDLINWFNSVRVSLAGEIARRKSEGVGFNDVVMKCYDEWMDD